MSEGGGDSSVPELFLSGYFFDLSVNGVGGWHDERSEVHGLEYDDIAIVLLALIVVIASGQKVCLFVKDAGFVSKHKVIFN